MSNIYLITQTHNNGYDTYSGAVVVAESAERAINMHPSGIGSDNYNDTERVQRVWRETWARNPSFVDVQLIGNNADDPLPRVVLASFHSG